MITGCNEWRNLGRSPAEPPPSLATLHYAQDLMTDDRTNVPGIAFLLSQLGGQSSRAWTSRLARIGLEPREVMLFRFVALAEGRSQREVAAAIGLPASRIVALVDRLEGKGWIERRLQATDRRTHALHVTPAGRSVLERIQTASIEHEADLTSGLGLDERAALLAGLTRIATQQGLIAGVHPGFADTMADQSHDPPTGIDDDR
jgi:DNA-binding MarR family transcriptional regulator